MRSTSYQDFLNVLMVREYMYIINPKNIITRVVSDGLSLSFMDLMMPWLKY